MGKSITDLSSVATVGLDLAKHAFQVQGVDASGRVVIARAMRRNKLLEFFASLPACLVGARGLRIGAPLGTRADQARL
jgi:transposase